jgi:AGCS family alanine or glycine:cation symporter
VVCTLTALVILSSGLWNRDVDIAFPSPPRLVKAQAEGLPGNAYTLITEPVRPPEGEVWAEGEKVYAIVGGVRSDTTRDRIRVPGRLAAAGGGRFTVDWVPTPLEPAEGSEAPFVDSAGAFFSYPGATLTAKAFDASVSGLGMWLVSLAAWLFAISTMISWSYYGEQGVIYLFGERFVTAYRAIYCLLIVVACIPWLIRTDAELDTFTALGTGVMLWANIPIMVIFGKTAMRAYHQYFAALKAGRFTPHAPHPVVEVVEGRD